MVGDFQLSADDILGCRDFDDSIGANGWPLETHVLGGMKFVFLAGRGYHQIPFRCALPQKVDNLLVAGRCASTTPEGQASLRVSGPCFALGQAVGTAAALSVAGNILPAGLDITRLQQQLVTDGVWLG
ncbi:MAG: FAD-dependent oxidoreductase [Rhodospirillales bacterium]